MPTLYDLLQPVAKRPKTFSVGTREYDPIKVGYETKAANPNDFVMDTSISGNHNTGHEYGTDLSEEDRHGLDRISQSPLGELGVFVRMFMTQA